MTVTQICVYAAAQTLTLNEKNSSLTKVFAQIEKQTSYVFWYENKLMTLAKPVTVVVQDETLENVLTICLKDQPFSYKVIGNTVVIKEKLLAQKATQPVPEPEAPLPFPVKGKVINKESGSPVQGASVVIKGSNKGTSSGKSGEFEIDAEEGDVLLVTHIGFVDQEVKVTSSNKNLVVNLAAKDNPLADVVVIGYGTVRKRDLTGAVAGLKSEQLAQSKVLSFQDAMQGRLSGVQIASSSGEPGSAVNISIRGSNTIYGATSPLYVIDGIPYDMNSSEVASASIGNGSPANPLASLNPSDIESIEVLKDASATAIYGSRGANGVILITTKSGKAGKMRIEYDGQLGFISPTRKLPVLNANEYIDYRASIDTNTVLFYNDTNGDGAYNQLDEPRDPYTLPQHDWQDEILHTGISQNHNISMSGGNANTTFSGGVGYYDQDAIIRNNDYQRYTLRLRVDHQQKKVKLGINANVAYSELNGATQSGGGNGIFNGVVQNLVISRPLEVYVPSWDVEGTYISPLSMIDNAYKNTSLIRNTLNAYLNYQFTKDLSLNVSIGGFLSSSKGKEFYGSNTNWGNLDKGKGILQENRAYSWTSTNQLIYQKRFKNGNFLNAMVAFERSRYNYERFALTNTNFADESTGIDDIRKGGTIQSISSNRDMNNRISWFGRVNYTLMNKHLFTATFRADGSDKFGPGNRYGYFPSFAYAWRMIQEGFMKGQSLFSDLKLRLSYGETGNERIPSYRYLSSMENAFYGGQLGLAPASQSNPDLKWETTIQYNAGVDIGLLKNRITMSLDYYYKKTKDMLLPAYVPSITGYLQQWQNLGRVDNEGIEIQISSKNIQTGNFSWQTDFNISSNRNTVKDIGNTGFIPVTIGGGWITNVGRVISGQAIGNAYGYEFDGVYQIADFTWQNNSDPSIPYATRVYALKPGITTVAGVNVQPGSFKFKDLNGDGTIDLDNDRTPISRSFPKFFGGLNNTFQYKNFDLSFLFDWSYGNQIFNESRYRLEGGVLNTWMNVTKDFWYNRWTPDNPTNEYGTYADKNATSQLASSYYVEDASWLRLRTLSIGYRLPDRLLEKAGIQSARIYLSGTNLLTWTSYSGFDPEISSGEPLLSGFDRISYPRSKTIMVGLNVSF